MIDIILLIIACMLGITLIAVLIVLLYLFWFHVIPDIWKYIKNGGKGDLFE